MEEINLEELFNYYKSKLLLCIILTVFVCLVGCSYCIFIQKPLYKSYTTIILGGTDNNTQTSITQNEITLNKSLVDTYTEVVKSRRVLNSVIKELNLNLGYDELNSKINVTSLNDTEIIKISVSDEDPVLAKNIANVTAHYFSSEVVSLYNLDNVNVLDEAIATNTPYNINLIKQLIIYFLVGVVLSCGIVFIMFYFDRTIKNSDELEKKIGLPVLGVIEYCNKGGK